MRNCRSSLFIHHLRLWLVVLLKRKKADQPDLEPTQSPPVPVDGTTNRKLAPYKSINMMLDPPVPSFRLLPAAFGFWSDSGLLLCFFLLVYTKMPPSPKCLLPPCWLLRKVPELPCQHPKAPPPSFDRDLNIRAWMCSVTFCCDVAP